MKVTFIGWHCSECFTLMISFNSSNNPMREASRDPHLVNEGAESCPDLRAVSRAALVHTQTI